MAITSSTIISTSRQVDGRLRVDERHIAVSEAYLVSYLCEAGTDTQANLSANAQRINDAMKISELEGMITDLAWDYVQVETTGAELIAYVRAAYRERSREELVPVASRILEWITNGRFTDTQVRNAFGLTSAQWTTLKNKMAALVSANTTIITAEGE